MVDLSTLVPKIESQLSLADLSYYADVARYNFVTGRRHYNVSITEDLDNNRYDFIVYSKEISGTEEHLSEELLPISGMHLEIGKHLETDEEVIEALRNISTRQKRVKRDNLPNLPLLNEPDLRLGQAEEGEKFWVIRWKGKDLARPREGESYFYYVSPYWQPVTPVGAKQFKTREEAMAKAHELGYAESPNTDLVLMEKVRDSVHYMGYKYEILSTESPIDRSMPDLPLLNEPEIRIGQLADGQRLWLKFKDELKVFDDVQLKGRPNLLAELETAEAVYDSQSNSIKITDSPTKGVIGLVLPMPRVVELFTIIPPYGDSEGKTERDPLHKNPTDNRNFIDPKTIPEPYEPTLDYLTPTSKGDGYRAGQVTQADHNSKGNSPEVPRTTKGKGFRGVILTLKEDLADDRPEQVTKILMGALKGSGFSPLHIWWEKPDRGHDESEYDISEADNPRLVEIEMDWPAFQADLQYRRSVIDDWSFLLGQGRYPYFVQV